METLKENIQNELALNRYLSNEEVNLNELVETKSQSKVYQEADRFDRVNTLMKDKVGYYDLD